MRKLITIILLFISTQLAVADSIPNLTEKYVVSYFTDAKDIILFPKRWNTNQWITAASVTAATGALFFFDDNIQNWTQDHKTPDLNNISKYIAEPWGSPKIKNNYALFTTIGLFSYGIISHDKKSQYCSLSAAKAYLITGALTTIPKSLFGRQRPNAPDGPDDKDWRGFMKGESFFSGHTSVSFAFATVVAEYYKNTKWIPVVSYTFASLCGLSRIYDNKHWATDVFAGAAFGIAIGKLIAKNDQKLFLSYQPQFNVPVLTFKTNF